MTRTKRLALIGSSIISVFLLTGGFFVFAQSNRATPQPQIQQDVLSEREERRIVLEIISQPVFIQLPSEKAFQPAENDMDVPVGSTIRTGDSARAQILFSDKAITRLDENTEVRVETADLDKENFQLFIEAGRIWNRLQKILGSFTTETGNMTATVRGTSYEHSAEDDSTDMVRVNTGEVVVECIATGWSEDMTAQTKVQPDCEKNIGTNWESWEAIDSIDEWIRWNQQRDVTWMKRFQIENEEVLGTASARLTGTITPTIASPKNTITPSPVLDRTQNTNTNTNSNTTASPTSATVPTKTLTPTHTPTPTQTPIPEKPVLTAQIRSAQIVQVLNALLVIKVSGSGFQEGDTILLKSSKGESVTVQPYPLDLSPENYVTGSMVFPQHCGRYEIAVQRNGVQITEFFSDGLYVTVCLDNPLSIVDIGGILR